MFKATLFAATTLALTAGSTVVWAQDASNGRTSGPAAGAAPGLKPGLAGHSGGGAGGVSRGPRIEEVVVTARRRAENIQSVPVSVTAITASTLRAKAIETPYDLVNSTPGVSVQSGSSSRNDVGYTIRGQGITFGSSPSVVTYFAEVPQQSNMASGGSNITFYDLTSIQVLKGPQGTLFGRSTTGGAVLLTPVKPSNQFDGFVEASYGNYNSKEFTGAINVPVIADKLDVRIAGDYSGHDGFSKSLTTGQQLDDRNRGSYRISVLARPTDYFNNTTIWEDNVIDENGTASVLYRFQPQGSLLDTTPGTGPGYDTVAFICGLIQGGQSCINSRVNAINSVRDGLQAEYNRLSNGGSVRRVDTSNLDFNHSHVQEIIDTAVLNLGDLPFLGETTIKNIFSTTRNLQSDNIREIQDSPVPTGVVFNDYIPYANGAGTGGFGKDNWLDVYSEEAQLAGRIRDKHNWLLGFFRESSNQNQYLNAPVLFEVLDGAFSVPQGLAGISNDYQNYNLTQTGYFAQGTFDFSDVGVDGLKFTAGYRYSTVTSDVTDFQSALSPTQGIFEVPPGSPGYTPPVSQALTESADSYTFSLDYKLLPHVLVYGATRQGFKQGGINTESVTAANAGVPGALPTFGPEKVRDYEVGVKADYQVVGMAGRTNIALFTGDYTNLQRAGSFFNTLSNTTGNQIENIAGETVRGIEMDSVLKPTENFELDASYAYVDAEYNSFPGFVTNPASGQMIARIHSPVTGSPRHHLDFAGHYIIPMGGAGDLVLNSDISYQSKVNLSDDALYDLLPETQGGYAVINGRVDWNNIYGMPVDLSGYVKNATNRQYQIGEGNLISSLLGTTVAIYGDPMTFGFQLRYRFGASGR